MNSATKRCLNCGNECYGNYCSTCGQPTNVSEKINRASFFKSVSKSIARMTPGFWNTLVGLTFKPWIVVHEYIYGKRIKYSEPVTMLIQLMLYSTFIYTIIEYCTGIDFLAPDSGSISVTVVSEDGAETDMGLTNFMSSYPLLFRLIVSCIAAINCYVVYHTQGRRRHNLYEFLIAAIYMGGTIVIYNNLFLPINYYWPTVGSSIEMTLIILIGSLAIFKAFKIRPWWKAVSRWMLFILLNFIVLIAISLAIVLMFYDFD